MKVTKEEITSFLNDSGYPTLDMQQARHLGAKYGWNIISGTRKDYQAQGHGLGPGDYALVNITEPYSSYHYHKRQRSIDDLSWEEIKKSYGYSSKVV